jgi:hypothetical protein
VKELQALCLNVELLDLNPVNELEEDEMLTVDEDESLSVAVTKGEAGAGVFIPEDEQISELEDFSDEELDEEASLDAVGESSIKEMKDDLDELEEGNS